ncbi:Uncharacterised protein [Leclercia adecarboxylata]|uniref:Uncharacterized protein n=1 Tax=Leclercia adecarboxylata TaxID=83655 RepID=A0A4U9HGA8_9ENTR|nr:Uncharacterised protein [Leclercia adecarboxylata]
MMRFPGSTERVFSAVVRTGLIYEDSHAEKEKSKTDHSARRYHY